MNNKFEFISVEEKLDSEQTRKSLTYWQDVWRRLRKNKLSMAGLVGVIVILLFGLIGPIFVVGDYSDQILDYSNLPPRFEILEIDNDRYFYVTREYRFLETTKNGTLLGRLDQVYRDIPNRLLYFADDYEFTLATAATGTYANPGNLGADVFYSEDWGIALRNGEYPNSGDTFVEIVYIHPDSPLRNAILDNEKDFNIDDTDSIGEIILSSNGLLVSFTGEDNTAEEIIAGFEENSILDSAVFQGEVFVMNYIYGLNDPEDNPEGYEDTYVSITHKGEEVHTIHDKVSNTLYPWGTDNLGRNLLSRVMSGARISLTVAAVATLVNFFIGVMYGSVSGYVGGSVDNFMMRLVDIINSIPLVLYVILLMVLLRETIIDVTIFGNYFVIFRGQGGLGTIIIALGSVYWVGMARLVRGQVLGLKEQEYVLAARTIGVSNFKIIWRHLIPNAMGPIVVSMTMMIPAAVFTEAFLSFIGLGLSAPLASWGTLANDALAGLVTYPYQLFFPAGAIAITMLAFNFLGDGLRDALDPRLRKG